MQGFFKKPKRKKEMAVKNKHRTPSTQTLLCWYSFLCLSLHIGLGCRDPGFKS